MLLERPGEQFHKKNEKTEFRRAIFNAFAAVEEPLSWIVKFPKTPEAKQNAACIFYMILCHRGDTDQAWHLSQELQTRGVFLSFQGHLRLMQMFMACRETELATKVYDSLCVHFADQITDPKKRTKDELHTSLMLASQLGDWEEAHGHFDVMVNRGFADDGARLRLLHAYASVGDTIRTCELFNKFYPVGGLQKPTLRVFRTVIHAHIRAGDIQGINSWLERMTKAGIKPTAEIYNMMLLAFAKLQDLEAATAILSRMYQNKVKPDKVAFTTMISIMADRKDPVTAERIYQRAIQDGVVPDTVMNIALMDAHIEAGSWRGAIRVFDYINHTKLDGSRNTTRLFNVLLKAYVHIGAPFSVVSAIFQRMKRQKLTPNIITYSLVIQSACDSGQMDVARDLFNEFDTMPVFGKKKTRVDSYLLTILMAGYLRNNDPTTAKSIYHDMQTRALRPDAVTFGVIINSFANERSVESLAIAEEFMRGLTKTDGKDKAWLTSTRGGRPRALEVVFTPLLTIYGQDMDIRSVERLFDSMLAMGGEPTMVSLNVLMDAYRRVGNLESVEQIWGEAVEVARRFLNKDLFEGFGSETAQNKAQGQINEETPHTPHHNENSLCLSLSIYINALSAAGQHVKIAKVWRQVRDWGFAFDAHNWNHLAVALVRAGEVARAFEIVERVLLPYSLQNRRIVRSRRKRPQTPLSFFDDTVPLPQDVRHLASQPLPASAARGKVKKSKAEEPHAEAEIESDVKQAPLYELQQMSAHLQGWRTHLRVLDALGWAMETLKSGRPVLPMEGGVQRDRVISGDDRREDEPLDARKTLEWISTSYPRAMMMVSVHLLGGKYKPPY
ncbi:hypothetical protein BU17DRAFT_52286 [Hysterangium stoloniferum]|nr:hypothetical protein BU17DRAFT_52286 [Hysterangium stoloniferum]